MEDTDTEAAATCWDQTLQHRSPHSATASATVTVHAACTRMVLLSSIMHDFVAGLHALLFYWETTHDGTMRC
jgi:hypothetical protein